MDHLVCFLPGTLALGYYHYSRQQSSRKNYHGHIGGGGNGENGAKNNSGNGAKNNSGNGAKNGAKNGETSPEGSGARTDTKVHFSDRFSEHLELAEDIARTCYNMYNMTGTGLSPEIVYFGVTDDQQEMYIRPADSHNLLRPEYVESLFYLYHVTGNDLYRKQGVQVMRITPPKCCQLIFARQKLINSPLFRLISAIFVPILPDYGLLQPLLQSSNRWIHFYRRCPIS